MEIHHHRKHSFHKIQINRGKTQASSSYSNDMFGTLKVKDHQKNKI